MTLDDKKRGQSPRFVIDTVSQPARAVGRFKSAPCDAAPGLKQVMNPGGVAPSIRCGAYGNRPRLAPERLTSQITCRCANRLRWCPTVLGYRALWAEDRISPLALRWISAESREAKIRRHLPRTWDPASETNAAPDRFSTPSSHRAWSLRRSPPHH